MSESGIERPADIHHAVSPTDGVEIAYWVSGAGPHLVLVHGVSADHTRWTNILPRLQEYFTVCAVDRRGRGASGDADRYSVDLEFVDIAAVCDALDGPVHLLGHSYGGLCALGAAARTKRIDKLILYEPSINLDEPVVDPDTASRMEDLIVKDDREGVLNILFRDVVHVSDEELAVLRSDPSWEGRLRSAHTLPRELAAELPYAVEFRDMTVPTLLLSGGQSPPLEIAATAVVHEVLPNSRVVVLPGQGHVAMTTAPELFVAEVISFLLD